MGSSPYSIFGIGDINTSGLATNSAMGDVKYGYSSPYQINPANPASYSRLMTTSFNVGLFGQRVVTEDETQSQTNDNAGFRYMALGFNPGERIGFAFGLSPFSQLSYSISNPVEFDSIGTIDNRYEGEGGINKLYAGLSYMLVRDSLQTLSFGTNASFFFGSTNRAAQNEIPTGSNGYNTEISSNYYVTDFGFDFGINYRRDVSALLSKKENKRKYFNFGLTFTPETSLKTEYSELAATYSYFNGDVQFYQDTTSYSENTVGIEMPYTLGAGIGLEFFDRITKRKWLVAADYSFTNWSALSINNENQLLNDETQYSLGVEFIPNTVSVQKFFEFIRYRAGARYNQTRLFVENEQINEFGISLGLGIPIKTNLSTTSSFNLAVEYGQRGKVKTGLIQESFTNITIGLTLTPSKWDTWFKKRKID